MSRIHATPRVIRAIPNTPREPMVSRPRRELTPEMALAVGAIIGFFAGLITAPFHW